MAEKTREDIKARLLLDSLLNLTRAGSWLLLCHHVEELIRKGLEFPVWQSTDNDTG